MLTFFPVPYEDEIMYSTFARYHIRSGNISIKSTMEDLFSSNHTTAVMEIPSHFQKLIENMPINHQYTTSELIFKHTLYPFYGSFLPLNRAEEIIQSMEGENGGDIYTRIGIMASSITLNRFFRFCPECNKEDLERYGELYWHRVHQIPGVLVCPTHEVPLLDSSVEVRGSNKHEYVIPTIINCVSHDIGVQYPKNMLVNLIVLAKGAESLLNRKYGNKPLEWFREQYISKLKKYGFANINGNINRKEFLQSFMDYYGGNLLNLLQSPVDTKSEINWLLDMIRRKNKTSHPMRHLLLAGFLRLSLDDLFYKKIEYKPFGTGPWPCLNKAAEHYKNPVVNDLKINYDSEFKIPIGVFRCNCGFTYTRRGPDVDDNNKYQFSRIKEFGHIWEQRLKDLVESKLTLRATANELGVDPGTVKKYVDKMQLESCWERRSDKTIQTASESKENSLIEENRIKNREEWLKLRHLYPDKGKTELRNINKSLYMWLYKYDKNWLNENSPLKQSTANTSVRVDWVSRDNAINIKVKELVENMLTTDNKPEKICIGSIAKKLGVKALMEKHLDKLPRTKEYIETVRESSREFHIRKIKWAIREIEKEGHELMIWRIFRRAAIRQEYQEDLIDAITELLNNQTIRGNGYENSVIINDNSIEYHLNFHNSRK
ncbi:TnsD family Tn7-like transposition protein [Clostridium formicaceticum]|uniref:Transposase n=1 Tax=Clostridium formicaceticum TaxID=1497 RepID=A0AAC9RPG9_9CLOT|nr:TnsD family Tn7-like transposition protein [Clostridium formicaceticum]AOY74996.1 transposase [Clostridium formicaceticum]ARE89409.1 hypothetical protein CLFO_38160 [Clostridium formicaceticum]